nr:hypothetical protein Iba_chr05fCG4940 [Ipomoea batatas]
MGTAKWALLNRFLEGRFCIRAILIDNLSAVRFIEEDVEAGFLSSDVSALASLVRFLRCCDLALVALDSASNSLLALDLPVIHLGLVYGGDRNLLFFLSLEAGLLSDSSLASPTLFPRTIFTAFNG